MTGRKGFLEQCGRPGEEAERPPGLVRKESSRSLAGIPAEGSKHIRGRAVQASSPPPAPDTPPAASASSPWPVSCCATKRKIQMGCVTHPGQSGARCLVPCARLSPAPAQRGEKDVRSLPPHSPALGPCRGPGTAGPPRSQTASLWGSAPGPLTGQDSKEQDTGELTRARQEWPVVST